MRLRIKAKVAVSKSLQECKTKYAIIDSKGNLLKQLVSEKQAEIAAEQGHVVVVKKNGEWVNFF